MAVLADARAAGVDLLFTPATTLTLTLSWPTGSLTGRTFSSTLNGVALALTVNGDVMTVVATDTQTGALTTGEPYDWRLLETIDGTPEPIMVGTWSPDAGPNAISSTTLTVTAAEVDVDVTVNSAQASLVAHQRAMGAHQPLQALARYRADVARTRSETAGDADARSTALWIGPGDSLSEAFSPTKRELMWTRWLARRLNGTGMRSVQFVPASASTLNQVTAGAWPGGQAPWTYSATPGANTLYGPDLHAVTMVSGSTATLTFFGSTVAVVYTRTTGGPSAAAVTLDGAAQTAINAQGATLPGQQAVFSADGYGLRDPRLRRRHPRGPRRRHLLRHPIHRRVQRQHRRDDPRHPDHDRHPRRLPGRDPQDLGQRHRPLLPAAPPQDRLTDARAPIPREAPHASARRGQKSPPPPGRYGRSTTAKPSTCSVTYPPAASTH